MATLTGADLGTQFDARAWRSSEGAYYIIARNSATPTKLMAMKATTPTGVWTEQNAVNAPACAAGTIVATGVDIAGDVLKVLYQQVATPNDDCFFAKFDMKTDTWVDFGAGDYDKLVFTGTTGDNASCSIVQRPYSAWAGSESLIAAFADAIEIISIAKSRVGLARSSDDGATWTYIGYINGGVGNNQFCPRAIIGVDANVHVAWIENDGAANNVMERTLSIANALQTLRDTTLDAIATLGIGIPIIVNRTNTLSDCLWPFARSNSSVAVLRMQSAADQGVFNVDTISADALYTGGGQAAVCLALNGQIADAMFVKNADRDIYFDQDAGSSTWGTDTSLL